MLYLYSSGVKHNSFDLKNKNKKKRARPYSLRDGSIQRDPF